MLPNKFLHMARICKGVAQHKKDDDRDEFEEELTAGVRGREAGGSNQTSGGSSNQATPSPKV